MIIHYGHKIYLSSLIYNPPPTPNKRKQIKKINKNEMVKRERK